jgi:hypothetical protein
LDNPTINIASSASPQQEAESLELEAKVVKDTFKTVRKLKIIPITFLMNDSDRICPNLLPRNASASFAIFPPSDGEP